MKRVIFIIAIFVSVLVIIIMVKNSDKKYNIEDQDEVKDLYEYGDYIEGLDIPPNTIVARINDEEILFHEVESYRKSINNSIESGHKESKGKNAFYEVLGNKLAAYMAKKYPDVSNQNLNIDSNLEKTKNEWLNGFGEYTVEEAREKWLNVLAIEKDEIWLNEEDWITYLQNRSIEMQLVSKGNSIISDFRFSKPELANDKVLEEKLAEYNKIKELQKQYINEGKQNKALKLASKTIELLMETREIYLKDLILNSDIELCLDRKELSYTVPTLYSE